MLKVSETQYRIIAILLQFPDGTWLRGLGELKSASRRVPDDKTRCVISAFVDDLADKTLLHLQQAYTEAFDLNPAMTMNMSCHLPCDGKDRAALLAELRQIYHAGGYQPPDRELPDFLPALVELLAVCRDAALRENIWPYLAGIEGLVERLRRPFPLYADLLDLIADDYRHWVQGAAPRSISLPARQTRPYQPGPLAKR